MALVEVTKKNNIAVITMNRPEALNALNCTVITELELVVAALENDRGIRGRSGRRGEGQRRLCRHHHRRWPRFHRRR